MKPKVEPDQKLRGGKPSGGSELTEEGAEHKLPLSPVAADGRTDWDEHIEDSHWGRNKTRGGKETEEDISGLGWRL